MRRRKHVARPSRLILLAGAAAVAALLTPGVRADVNANATWRLASGITTATPAGNRVYVGGAFTELSTPSTIEQQFYDLVTGQVRSECARSTDPSQALTGIPDYRGGLLVVLNGTESLADQLGAFTPPGGATMARVADTCLWDRPFAGEVINPANPFDRSMGLPARVGNVILASNAILGTDFKLRAQVGAFAADSGRRIGFREYPGKSDLGVLGASSSRVIVRVQTASAGPYVLGALDPTTLALTESTSVLADESVGVESWVRGDRLYRHRPAPSNLLEAYDLTTLQPVSGWTAPSVPSLLDVEVANGRVFLATTSVNGSAVTAPAALVASSGAIDATWTPPALTRKAPLPGGQTYVPTILALATDGTRLFFSGDFERVGGVDRDGQAALRVTNAALDPWDTAPWVVSPIEPTTNAIMATRPTALNRTTRRFLAAIDRTTGIATAWNPNDQARVLLHTPTPVSAIAADGPFVYFASATQGEVLRADATSGDVDQAWRLLVSRTNGTPGVVTTMIASGGVVYLGGQFDIVSGTTFPATPRVALAAVGADGGLRAWAPSLSGPAGTTLFRAMLLLNGTMFLGGDFTQVNSQSRLGFAAVNAASGSLAQPEMFVLGETSIYGLATDGVQVYVAGSSFGAPLVGSVSVPDTRLETFSAVTSVPRGVALVAGRLYAGAEFDIDTRAPTSRQDVWGEVVGDDTGLVHLRTDGTLDYYAAIPGNPPGPPTLTAGASGNTVTMSWTPAPSGGVPTSYTLYAGSVSGGRDIAAVPVRGTTSFSGTAPTGLYYLSVVARNAYGTSAPSNEVAVQAGCLVAPVAPSPMTYTSAGSSVVLWWAASPTATAYALEAGRSPGATDLGVVPLGNVQALAATVPLGTYYVRARAGNACGTSPLSNEIAVTLDGSTPLPAPPTGFAATVSGTTLTLQWAPPKVGGTPAGYVIEAGVSPGGTIAIVPTAATRFVVPNAPPGTFYLRVRSANAAGGSAPTADVSVVVP